MLLPAKVTLFPDTGNNDIVFLTFQCPHGVQHGQHRDTNIRKNGHPHRCQSYSGQYEHRHLDANSQPHILTGYRQRTSGNTDSQRHLLGMVIQQHHVSGLDGSIATQTTHRYADVCTCQHWGVVDAVTHKCEVRG